MLVKIVRRASSVHTLPTGAGRKSCRLATTQPKAKAKVLSEPNAPRRRQNRKLSVAFVLSPKFTLLALSAFVDTLRLAADDGDRSRPIQCDWAILSHDMLPIRSSCGLAVLPTSELQDPTQFDYVAIVGGLLDGPQLAPALADYLRLAAKREVPLIGVCTGSFVLARLGLMAGRRCCVSWFHYAQFVDAYPELVSNSNSLFEVDEDRLTCPGGTSVVHLASWLISKHCGPLLAAKALRIMIERAPLSADSPQPQPPIGVPTEEPRVRKAMLLIERNMASPLSASFVARHAGMSLRQMERLFKAEVGMTPTAWALKLRLTHARFVLINGRDSVRDVALQCGFVSSSHFARSFRALFGVGPQQARDANSRVPIGLT